MSRCPNCDTPLHITRAASPVIESDGAHEYRMNAINSAPPKSSEPEKVIEWEDGDEWRFGDYLWHVRGNYGWMIDEFVGERSDFSKSRNDPHFKPISQLQGDAKAEQLGYSVHRTAKVEPTRAVFEFLAGDVVTKNSVTNSHYIYRANKCFLFPEMNECDIHRSPFEVVQTREQITAHLDSIGITAKFPEDTPASDSVKGERDKFGREIIERLGGAFIVKAGGGFMVSRPDGLWWDGGQWHDETNPHNPWATNIAESQTLLPSAAKSLELPTANPAASAKGQDTRFASDFLELDRAIAELNRRITKLEARQ